MASTKFVLQEQYTLKAMNSDVALVTLSEEVADWLTLDDQPASSESIASNLTTAEISGGINEESLWTSQCSTNVSAPELKAEGLQNSSFCAKNEVRYFSYPRGTRAIA